MEMERFVTKYAWKLRETQGKSFILIHTLNPEKEAAFATPFN